MTNEQLLILLRQYRIRLERIYRDIDNGLPAQCPRYTERRYIGSSLISLLDKDPAHWEDVDGRAVILDDLYDFINELGNAEDILKLGIPAPIQQEAGK